MDRRTTIAALAALGCGSMLPAFGAATLKVGHSPAPDFVSAWMANELGTFERDNLAVELVPVALTTKIIGDLQSGALQLGMPSPASFLAAIDQGADLVVVAGANVTAKNNNVAGAISRTDVVLTNARDFVGKTVGVPGVGATLHLVFQRWLQESGVTLGDVKFVEVPFPAQSDALKAARVDAIVTADPGLGSLVATGAGTRVAIVPDLLSGDSQQAETTSVFVASRQWANANADCVEAFRRAIALASHEAQSDSSKSRMLLDKLQQPPLSRRLQRLPVAADASLTRRQLNWWADVMQRQQLLKRRPDIDRLVPAQNQTLETT